MSLGLLKVERLQVVLDTILHDKMKGPVGILQSPRAGEGMTIDFFQHNTGLFCFFLSGGGWRTEQVARLRVPHSSCQPQAEPSPLPRTASVNWVSG